MPRYPDIFSGPEIEFVQIGESNFLCFEFRNSGTRNPETGVPLHYYNTVCKSIGFATICSALVYWLRQKPQVLEVVGSNPNTTYEIYVMILHPIWHVRA